MPDAEGFLTIGVLLCELQIGGRERLAY